MGKYKKLYGTLLLGLIAIIILLTAVFSYSRSIEESYKEENINSLKELSNQGALMLHNEIKNKQNLLAELSHDVSRIFVNDPQAAAAYLEEAAERNSFKRIGVALTDGRAYTTDGVELNISEREYFSKAIRGHTAVSRNLDDYTDGGRIAVYAVPIFEDGSDKRIGVLFATYSLDTFRKTIEVSFFGGAGYSYVVQENGDVVVDSQHSESFKNFKNVYAALLTADPVNNKDSAEKLWQMINSKKGGYIEFYNGSQKYMYCSPIGVNNWMLLTVTPASVIEDKINMVLNKTYLLGILLIAIFLLFIWHIKKGGYIEFYNGSQKYMYCSPIGVNNWMLLTVTPASVIEDKINMVLNKTYLLGILLIAIFLLFIWHIMRIHTRNQKELMDIAYVDEVTGGYSFAKFFKEAELLLPETDKKTAIVSMDIDGFKYFNDMFGYGEGNDLLRYIWQEVKASLNEGEILAHGVADTFIFLLRFDTREELLWRINDLCLHLNNYITKSGQVYKLSLSMGIYEVDGETDDIVSMADRAYIARQTIKNKGDTAWAFYDGAVRDKLLHEKEIESQMEKALAEGEFIAYYQPKYSTKEQKLIGAEALVRWRRSDGIIVPPYQFVPLFERNGFINKVDRYMFELVCRQQMRWLKQGLIPVPISVNMSRMCLYDPHIVDEYIGVLNGSGLSAAYIKLELTESAFFENISIMNNVIEALHKVGIKVLMDDFGTGYSSMMMLKNVAIDVLKLDKSFVDDIGDDRSEKIISNIIYLAHSLQIEVTAEGVETAAQFEFLKSVGCDYIQGYYFGKPQPAEDFAALLQKEFYDGSDAGADKKG